MKVLIADDDRVLTRLLAVRLKAKGWQVEVAHDAMQAFMYAMRAQPDVIALDIGMPGGTGHGVLEKLKQSSRTGWIPVLVISGSVEPDAAARAVGLGAAAFVAKPVDPEALHASLSQLVAQPAA
jgi:two-component system, OmpR family, KDP operon response regulator KdpE